MSGRTRQFTKQQRLNVILLSVRQRVWGRYRLWARAHTVTRREGSVSTSVDMSLPRPIGTAFDRLCAAIPPSVAYAFDRVYHAVLPEVTVVPLPSSVVVQTDVTIPMRDGQHLFCNIYQPRVGDAGNPSALPVIMCAHPYSKDILPIKGTVMNTVPLEYRAMRMSGRITMSEGCSWEAPDPAVWIPDGFIIVNMDLRGFGKSIKAANNTMIQVFSDQEAQDYYDAIEWVGTQSWCNGKVGLLGVSYLAISQYKVAALHPPHLAAICPWEGLSDLYKDLARQGGVQDTGFTAMWCSALKNNLSENLTQLLKNIEKHDHDFYQAKIPALGNITCPALVCMSFSDQGLHTNGSMRVFRKISSEHKWLYTHRSGKWDAFYSKDARRMQLMFFNCFLKGDEKSGIMEASRVRIEVRESRGLVNSILQFPEPIYPPLTTKWTQLHLSGDGAMALTDAANDSVVSFQARSSFATFKYVFDTDTIVSGPMKLSLLISSPTLVDMNLFVCVRYYGADGVEVNFEGMCGWANDVVAKGWQRVALRKPFPSYDEIWDCDKPFNEIQLLVPCAIEPVLVQLLPSSTMFRQGCTMALEVHGRFFFPVSPLTQISDYEPSPLEGQVDIHCRPSIGSTLLFGTL